MESLFGSDSNLGWGSSPSLLGNLPSETGDSKPKKVFIVHGRNEQLKDAAENLVRSLGLEPIILHKQANQGRTIIEKFSDHARDVSFAIVLLSSDDEGRLRQNPPTELRARARQNVVFELGFFFGSLGRGKVCAVYDKDLESPSDIQGIAYVERDPGGLWKYDVAKELSAAGYDVDLSKI